MTMTADEVRAAVEEGQRLRGWIANGYAQVEYLLGDVISKAIAMPEYAPLIERLPHRVEKRIAKVRKIVEAEGFFATYRQRLEDLIESFEAHHQTRNLLSHGFCTAHYTPDGDFGLEFRKWHRDGERNAELVRTFRLIDLEYVKAQLTHISQVALELALTIHEELGMVAG
ncbi:MAG: hypothetical protein KGM17_08420 [Sphingomonadales bacterium]|nr:hypothetical protein [Sphingomonadales bacterium]